MLGCSSFWRYAKSWLKHSQLLQVLQADEYGVAVECEQPEILGINIQPKENVIVILVYFGDSAFYYFLSFYTNALLIWRTRIKFDK